MDSEGEIVPKSQRDKKKSEKQLAEEAIHGSTLPPTIAGAAPVRTSAPEPERPDGPDQRDWNVGIRDVSGKARLKVGQSGLVWAQTAQEVTATLHDLQATDQPAAMLSNEKADPASVLAPVRMWKGGKATVRRLWLTQLGSGENGQVEYIGTSEEMTSVFDLDEDEEEEWEEKLSTEVFVLRIHQEWCSKETCLDLFGPSRMRSDTFGCARKHSEAFGRFSFFLKFFNIFFNFLHISNISGAVAACISLRASPAFGTSAKDVEKIRKNSKTN